jgi:hypothetical protein
VISKISALLQLIPKLSEDDSFKGLSEELETFPKLSDDIDESDEYP